MAASKPPDIPPPQSKARPRRPWRDNLEAFGVAILMAVLLKPMIIEAYQIPTPSMQPTLMGSADAGVFDRILVDKTRYLLFEPKRWDIVVFRYPIRRNQNYVKRIVGMPGDRLRIAGGNLYQVGDNGEIVGAARKPDRIQEDLWKQVYPARRHVSPSEKILGEFFVPTSGGWKEEGDDLEVTPTASGQAFLSYSDIAHDGLSNQIWDGYPTDTAKAIRSQAVGETRVGVQDVRFSTTLTPQTSPSLVRFELRLAPEAKKAQRYDLVIENGKGRLRIRVGDEEVLASEEFDCPLPADTATHLAFAHIDDRLVAWRNGEELASQEVGIHRYAGRLESRWVQLSCETRGGDRLRFADLEIDRDLHYLPEGLDDRDALQRLTPDGMEQSVLNHVIVVPKGHYFMMGDNTLASADSRQWHVLTIGVEDGKMVDPKTHPNARLVSGNRRPWGLSEKPDTDENPVIVAHPDPQTSDRIAFTDDNGEVLALWGKISAGYDPRARLAFMDYDGDGSREWVPEEKHVFFVPREHILGRPLAAFWPLSRIGFIR